MVAFWHSFCYLLGVRWERLELSSRTSGSSIFTFLESLKIIIICFFSEAAPSTYPEGILGRTLRDLGGFWAPMGTPKASILDSGVTVTSSREPLCGQIHLPSHPFASQWSPRPPKITYFHRFLTLDSMQNLWKMTACTSHSYQQGYFICDSGSLFFAESGKDFVGRVPAPPVGRNCNAKNGGGGPLFCTCLQ